MKKKNVTKGLASIWREIWEKRGRRQEEEDWRAGSNRMLSAGWFTRRSVTINPSDKLWMPPRGTLLRRPSLQASFNLQRAKQSSNILSLCRSPSIFLIYIHIGYASFLSTYSLSASFYPSLFFLSRTEREEKHEEEYGGKVKLIINFPRQINKEKKRRGIERRRKKMFLFFFSFFFFLPWTRWWWWWKRKKEKKMKGNKVQEERERKKKGLGMKSTPTNQSARTGISLG